MASNPLGTALVTGASSGIGAVYADRLAHRGHDLVLVARDAARLETLAARLRSETGRTIDVLPADLATAEGVARIEARLGSDVGIALLVNNAGISTPGDLLDGDPADIDRLIAVNITAPTRLAAAAARAFVARKAGAIVNIASVLALAPEISASAYSGSKAYLLNLSLRLEMLVRESGVRVQAVLPGATRTEIWARSGRDVDSFPADMVMEAAVLVDAALVGFDRGEVVTIPALADESQWTSYNEARLAMLPNLSKRAVAARYL